MYCINCGKEIANGSKFCTSCGKLTSAGGSSWMNKLTKATSFVASASKPVNTAVQRPAPVTFKATKKLGRHLEVDERNKMFKVDSGKYRYENLLSYELMEDGDVVTKGGLGSAVAGGLLFGGVGAIVGGVAGHKSKNICSSLKICITLKNCSTSTVYIPFITSETKINSEYYRRKKKEAQECLSVLAIIADQNATAQQEQIVAAQEAQNKLAKQAYAATTQQETVSVADEIAKFKKLLDAGVLTQEEFNEQKKRLLGM